MNFRFLFLISVLASLSCQPPQKAQALESPDESKTEIIKSTEIFGPQQPQIASVDTSRFTSIKIKRTDKKKNFSLHVDIEYPQLNQPANPYESRFNQYIKKHVTDQIRDFTDFLIKKESKAADEIASEYEINLHYDVEYYSEGFTSIVLNWDGFSGYLNQDSFPSTINYDLKRGKVVHLKDIFTPQSNYLNEISENSRKILKVTCLTCKCGNNINPGDRLPDEMIREGEEENVDLNIDANAGITYQDSIFFESGTEPKEKNFSNWSITTEGLKITFGEYQVGPGCIGIIRIVIPFSELEPILRKDLNFIHNVRTKRSISGNDPGA